MPPPSLAGVDLAILAAYVGLVLGLSVVIARRQRSGTDYFLAGRRMGGTWLALSVVANQVSAVSLVGAPAFVALRDGGGLRWLQYEIAVPLAMLALMVLLLPTLRAVPGASVYAYGEQRFGRATRRVLAASFVVSRGLALGVVLYASSLVLAHALGTPLAPTLAALGLVSVLYTSLGGIVADIWTDVVQLVLLWGGTIAATAYVIAQAGVDLVFAVPEARMTTLVPEGWGTGSGSAFGLWPMLIGGFFLYVSYYGCDQSQAQRLLAARDLAAARRVLLVNGLLRFPLVLTYCAFGVVLAGLVRTDPSLAALMEGQPADRLVPAFIVSYLPAGLRGLFLAAILAAAMSSIDSAMNSLAAVTLEDVFDRQVDAQRVWLSRATSFAWGTFAVVAGLAFAQSGAGVLEAINQVGSAFYGPMLAVFVIGVAAPGANQRGAIAGLATGVLCNLLLARFAPEVSWLWWNPAGFAACAGTALLLAPSRRLRPVLSWPPGARVWLLGAFAFMLLVLAAIPRLWQFGEGWSTE
jgi:SSS family solute:Na+ symporter